MVLKWFASLSFQFKWSPDALTKGVSLFLTRTMIVMSVRNIPKLEMQIGRIAKFDPCHMYWTYKEKSFKNLFFEKKLRNRGKP